MKEQAVFDLDAFIERPGIQRPEADIILSTAQIFDALDAGVRDRQVITLVGPSGSGKKTLLAGWAKNRSKAAPPDEIILFSMSPKPDKSLPPICIALSRIWDELEQLARPVYTRNRSTDGRNIRMYNTRQLESLRIEVQKAISERNIRAIVGTRCHLLDTDGLTWLLDMRNYYDRQRGFKPRFAFILACTNQWC